MNEKQDTSEETARFVARDVEATCACAGLRKASRAVTQLFDAALAPCGLRATQFTVLNAVALSEGVSMSRLAERLVMDRTTLTRNLRPLEKEGLIRIERGADQRERLIRLTRRGRTTFERALPHWIEAQKTIVDGFGIRRWRALLGELEVAIDAAHGALAPNDR